MSGVQDTLKVAIIYAPFTQQQLLLAEINASTRAHAQLDSLIMELFANMGIAVFYFFLIDIVTNFSFQF